MSTTTFICFVIYLVYSLPPIIHSARNISCYPFCCLLVTWSVYICHEHCESIQQYNNVLVYSYYAHEHVQVVILLRCLFEELSVIVDKQLVSIKAVEAAHEDERLSQVMTRLQLLFKRTWLGNTRQPPRSLKHQEIEAESKYFPLCMKNLFKKLHQTNRLRHPERFRFTLFLKDIGLPLEENIAFWEKYYSKCSVGACEHTWGAHEKRYIYSIRHTYGLEGARYNRPSHSCSKLQVWHSNHCLFETAHYIFYYKGNRLRSKEV